MENEINTRNSNESNSDIGVDEQRRNEDDEMENSVEEIIISDDEGDVNVRQLSKLYLLLYTGYLGKTLS